MSYLEQYRPPGRSNRSGRSNADNDVFEGLPVKQWAQSYSKVSLAPPQSETEAKKDDKWGEPPMPRDYQLLNPWTQHLLRSARSGKVGTKRKQEADPDEDKPEEEAAEEDPAKNSNSSEERGYVAKKWKPISEHALEPEHKHFNFLAKRRRGLPSLYGPDVANGVAVPMRKTKVQKTDANGEVAVYEVLVPEGQVLEGEIADSTELADAKPVTAAPGTVIEGVGVANDEGVVVAEHLRPNAPRRNRPPPKKKGGPGRGKKRVTFTNPDGSTYTTIVPNATKIVPQPGQTVKHVAKGEEALADISAEEAAKRAPSQTGEDGEEGDDDDDEEGDDDDYREEGELTDDDAPATGNQTPEKSEINSESQPREDVRPTQPAPTSQPSAELMLPTDLPEPDSAPDQQPETTVPSAPPIAPATESVRDVSSSPEMPLAKSHSRTASLAEPPPVSLDSEPSAVIEPSTEEPLAAAPPEEAEPDTASVAKVGDVPPDAIVAKAAAEVADGEPAEPVAEVTAEAVADESEKFEDGDEDLLGNLEKHIVGDGHGGR
ncbi:hypothetical protein AC579_9907 [Pseudocercospora musae]|uniref:Uncharacterized protein n=1 Tax=Pseudocercospora musae TaxID=113226 RepID=A0A139IFA2_9PEZI|nr:hypothetical protein AC579_9907 [Pseudocercospora musae]